MSAVIALSASAISAAVRETRRKFSSMSGSEAASSDGISSVDQRCSHARHFRLRLTMPCQALVLVTPDVDARHAGHGARIRSPFSSESAAMRVAWFTSAPEKPPGPQWEASRGEVGVVSA